MPVRVRRIVLKRPPTSRDFRRLESVLGEEVCGVFRFLRDRLRSQQGKVGEDKVIERMFGDYVRSWGKKIAFVDRQLIGEVFSDFDLKVALMYEHGSGRGVVAKPHLRVVSRWLESRVTEIGDRILKELMRR